MKRSNVIERATIVAASVLVAAQLLMCSGSGSSAATACNVVDDCWSAPEAADLGRCAPKEVACLAGRCRVACAQPCEVVDPLVSPCRDARLVCNQSKSGKEGFAFCAGGPIACESLDDCPLSIPTGSAGEAWVCEDKVCRLSGFNYDWR